MSRILIPTDAWPPQLNGVAITSKGHVERLRALGHTVEVLSPDMFPNFPCPTYPEIRLSMLSRGRAERLIRHFDPDYIHVNTEGPIGMAALLACRRLGLRFSTSFRSKFPEYINLRYRVPVGWGYAAMRWFHNSGSACLVPTKSLRAELSSLGFRNLRIWARGVDTDLFRPRTESSLPFKRPIFLYAGRVAVEKNVEAFLSLDLPGTKVVVGDGPQRQELEARYPAVRFLGPRFGEDLASVFSSSDVLVFPSRTDTFGNVIIEALASGTPVAAYPVTGPADIIGSAPIGALDEDLKSAALAALRIPRDACRAHALSYSWEESIRQFMSGLVEARSALAAQPMNRKYSRRLG